MPSLVRCAACDSAVVKLVQICSILECVTPVTFRYLCMHQHTAGTFQQNTICSLSSILLRRVWHRGAWVYSSLIAYAYVLVMRLTLELTAVVGDHGCGRRSHFSKPLFEHTSVVGFLTDCVGPYPIGV